MWLLCFYRFSELLEVVLAIFCLTVDAMSCQVPTVTQKIAPEAPKNTANTQQIRFFKLHFDFKCIFGRKPPTIFDRISAPYKLSVSRLGYLCKQVERWFNQSDPRIRNRTQRMTSRVLIHYEQPLFLLRDIRVKRNERTPNFLPHENAERVWWAARVNHTCVTSLGIRGRMVCLQKMKGWNRESDE